MYREKTYRCGKTIWIEKTKTRVYPKGEQRSAKRKPTPEEKREENARQAERALARKIEANFGEEDYWVTLTYRKENRPGPQEAAKLLKKFLAEMRKTYRKENHELKYIVVTEYQEKAIHHHLITNGIGKTMQLIRKAWPHGRPDCKLLDESGEYSELASYMIKETEKTFRNADVPQKQRYSCSRNLITPQPKVRLIRAKEFRKDPRPYKGYEIIKESVVSGQNLYGYEYQYYKMIKTGGHNETGRRNLRGEAEAEHAHGRRKETPRHNKAGG